MNRISHGFGIAAAAAAIVLVFAVVAGLWSTLGASNISAAGWAAMGFGIVATMGLGVGLMALVFISNRRGFDEPDRGPQ